MRKPIYEVFQNAQMRKPAASHKEKLDWFMERMKSDPLYLDDLAKEYFDRNARIWTGREIDHDSYTFARTPQAEQRIELARQTRETNAGLSVAPAEEIGRHEPPTPTVSPQEEIERRRKAREEGAARTAAALDTLKAKVREALLLDMLLPDGTKVRDATGAKMLKSGDWHTDVGKRIKPTQVVGRHLTEANLRDIYARYFQRNTVKAA